MLPLQWPTGRKCSDTGIPKKYVVHKPTPVAPTITLPPVLVLDVPINTMNHISAIHITNLKHNTLLKTLKAQLLLKTPCTIDSIDVNFALLQVSLH